MLTVLEPSVYWDIAPVLIPEQTVVYNFNANIVNPLIPSIHLMPNIGFADVTSKEFDSLYIDLLLNDDRYFVNLMNVMIPLRDGKDVFLLIYNEESIFQPINETLLKLIQQRYGYNYQQLKYASDFDQFYQSSFTTPGIQIFDQDFNRYQQLMMIYDPQSFLNEEVYEGHL